MQCTCQSHRYLSPFVVVVFLSLFSSFHLNLCSVLVFGGMLVGDGGATHRSMCAIIYTDFSFIFIVDTCAIFKTIIEQLCESCDCVGFECIGIGEYGLAQKQIQYI